MAAARSGSLPGLTGRPSWSARNRCNGSLGSVGRRGLAGLRGFTRFGVFAVEATSLELAWAGLPAAEVTIEVGGQCFDVDGTPPAWYRRRLDRPIPAGTGGPGALLVTGLQPGTCYDVLVSAPAGGPRRLLTTAQTMPSPPGQVLARFATISDCHIGDYWVGPLRRLHDPHPRPPGLEPYAVRCAEAAIAEVEQWDAELLVVKGDVTAESQPWEADQAAAVLGAASMPVHAILGNHDVRGGRADVIGVLNQAPGVQASREAKALDLPGVRIVLGHSPVPGLHGGRLARSHARELAELVAEAPGPAVVALHHPPRRWPVATYYPPAISWQDSSVLLRELSDANPATLLIAGHTHRNRRYRVGGIEVAEVGSTKDFPGEWAGYTVYEGGIRQVVHRIARPDAIAWTEMTRRAMGGVWGWWSPGTMSDRCWDLQWPSRVVQ